MLITIGTLKVKSMADDKHPCLVPWPITAGSVKPSFNLTLALCPL